MTRPLAGGTFSGQLNAGNYPNYQDTVCNSNGEYFCDPASVFSMEERQGLTAELRTLRENHPVTCGHLLNDPVDPRHYQPFYLGVAMATKWPSGESDPDSLQQFGQIIAAEWSMDRLFVGSPQPYLRCPNTAILIFLPEIRRAFVSSASCEFICQDRGGPEVATAALAALDNEGPVAAVRAAMREAYSIVSRTSSGPGHEQARATAQLSAGGNVRVDGSAAGHAVVTQGRTEETTPGGITSVVVQRILFGFALVALIVSVLIAFAVIFLAPSLFTSRRRRK